MELKELRDSLLQALKSDNIFLLKKELINILFNMFYSNTYNNIIFNNDIIRKNIYETKVLFLKMIDD